MPPDSLCSPREAFPLGLLLQSLQTEFFEIKKADTIMHRHKAKWMDAVEKWLQNQARTQEQLEAALTASVAEYNDKVSSENDRVPVLVALTQDTAASTSSSTAHLHGTRKVQALSRCSAPSPEKSDLPLGLSHQCRAAAGDSNPEADLKDMINSRPDVVLGVDRDDGERPLQRPTAAIRTKQSDASISVPLGLEDVTPFGARRESDFASLVSVAPAGSGEEDAIFEDPFRRNNKNKINVRKGTGSKKRSHQKISSWLLLTDEQEDSVLRKKAEQISVLPDESLGAESQSTKWIQIRNNRVRVDEFLRSPATEFAIAIMILTNAVVVGIEVDWTVNNPKETTLPLGYLVVGYMFNVLFALEVGLRMFALMKDFFVGSQWGWNIFDLSLVIASVVEFLVEIMYRSGTENISSLRIVRMVRITRILRVLRVARVVRLLLALRLLFVQILGTLRSVFWAMVLLVLILYTFGMIFAQVASEYIADNESDQETPTGKLRLGAIKMYWSTQPRSMFTLYKSITGGVDWENVSEALSDIHWFWVGLFITFLSFTIFAVLNVVVGVFCQSAIQSASMDHENAVRLKLNEKINFGRKMRSLFLDIDASKDGRLTYHELEAHLADEQVSAYFDSLGLDPSDSWDLFKLLDTDSSQQIDVDEFVDGCMRLRGPAKALDTAKIMYENRIMRKQLISFMRHVEMCLGSLCGFSVPSTKSGRTITGGNSGFINARASLSVPVHTVPSGLIDASTAVNSSAVLPCR